MLENLKIENVLFLDIESVPCFPDYNSAPEHVRRLWENKTKYLRKEDADTPETLYERAGIYSEFGKIICICVAFIHSNKSSSAPAPKAESENLNGNKSNSRERLLRIKAFFGDDEKKVLAEFTGLLNKSFGNERCRLCAHNGKEFDFPYLARRILVNGLTLPKMLDTAGKKPWEIQHIDTMDLWKFGDNKNYTSLELLALLFNIPTPKDDISGKDICRTYWQEKNLERIAEYCRKDVVTIAQLLLKFKGEQMIEAENIVCV